MEQLDTQNKIKWLQLKIRTSNHPLVYIYQLNRHSQMRGEGEGVGGGGGGEEDLKS